MVITYSQQRPLLAQDFIPVPRGNVIRLKNFNYHVLQDLVKNSQLNAALADIFVWLKPISKY